MAAKPNKKTNKKERVDRDSRDDLDLRDEILELKREVASLRKERDKLLIRLRKTQDESKRKDKQIEQLMDPTQNSEIRRLLSMKGAALLLNLKEQNNTLLQMLTEKNQLIKRLTSEIKTAKLYSRTNKTEPYRMEICRLRNMLLRSQEALKEAAQGPQVMTCMSAHSSTTSSEDTQTSQELEELRFMVQSLETHMQYSKELLFKKNQEIAALSSELGNVLVNDCCQKVASPKWGDFDRQLLKYERTRRCTSASFLEPFQQSSTQKPLNIIQLNRDKDMKSGTAKSTIQVDSTKIKKDLVEPTVDDKKTLEIVTGKRKKISKETWKIAVQKVRNSLEKNNKKVHTNSKANDEEVWEILKKGKSLSVEELTIRPVERKLSLPFEISDERLEKNENSEITCYEENEELVENIDSCINRDYRKSIDSSIYSDNSKMEGKLFEVEAEINNFPSVSSDNDGLEIMNAVDESNKDNFESVFGGENSFVFDEDEDEDDPITV